MDATTYVVGEADEARTVRLPGIKSAPITTGPGIKAKGYASRLWLGQSVHVQVLSALGDESLVADMILPNGRKLNKLIIAAGYGWVDPTFERKAKLLYKIEEKAREAGLGFWADYSFSPAYYEEVAVPPGPIQSQIDTEADN